MPLQERLLASDFDGTSHLTSEPAPNGMTVPKAYEHGIGQVFGDDALKKYKDKGGLINRAPFEITKQLLPNADIDTQRKKTEDLVAAKLGVLLHQVGKRVEDSFWPRLNPGFRNIWLPASVEPAIVTGVVSSGHDTFIRRSFEVHDLAPPDLTVTDDDMRPLLERLPAELCVKPSRLLLDLLHYQWLGRRAKIGEEAENPELLHDTRERILYIGDDYRKDGALAKNAGVKFVHVESGRSEAAFFHIGRVLNLDRGYTHE